MGTDMIACDGEYGGLFHKKCVDYDEEEALEADFWYCAGCDMVKSVEYVPLEEIEERPISGNNPDALNKAVELALDEILLESFERGFETRREIICKVVESKGSNSYKIHWRNEAKKK